MEYASSSPSFHTSSSQTESTRSATSHITAEKEQDFTKDNVASPIDLECHIQAERITKILDEAISKIKLALCLPNLVKEYHTLNSLLSEQHMNDLTFIFEQYDNPLFSASLLNMAAMEDIKEGDVSLKNRLNPELSHVIYIINSYPALKPIVEDMIDKMKLERDSCVERDLNPALEYLLAFEQFRSLMVIQMETTAADELAAKINTRKLEASNKKLIEKIEEYSRCLKDENAQFQETMKLKSDIIAGLEKELAMLQYDANIKLKKKILDSDRQMVLAARSHAVRSEILKEEEVEIRESYQALLKQHLNEEKNQRARRFKVETQLLSWLQKYDLEMGDKQAELDEFIQKYEEEEEKCEKLEAKLEEQDKEYIPLMAEREEEYHKEMTEKMNKFRMEHAARVIQMAWRDVLANRAEKKKLKKQIIKMQAAQAAAEAAALAAAKVMQKTEKKKK